MADYTKVNLRQVENLAPKFGMDDGLEARFATTDLGLDKSGVSLQRFGAGFRMPFGHTHKEQEELYVVVSGGGRVKIEDEIVELAQWDAVRIPGSAMRAVEAGPEGLDLLAFGAPNTGGPSADAEMEPGWWSD
jgi:mannose-6-phosphate isomerase-like protein (cupin superfamily)